MNGRCSPDAYFSRNPNGHAPFRAQIILLLCLPDQALSTNPAFLPPCFLQCYYWYKKIKAAHPNSAMGGFTRLLHSGYPDDWMDEIPTVVVDPLPPDLQTIANGYVVLNRPYAFKQWVETHLASIPERYVLMSEPDHLFLRPPPLWATPTRPAAFPFFYIEPLAPVNAEIIQKYNELKRPLKAFAPIGEKRRQLALRPWRDFC